MAIKLTEKNDGKVLEAEVTGKLAREDYGDLVPKFEQMVKEHGKVRVLFDLVDFHGWKASALWDEIKFDMKHFSDVERLALVGDKKWEEEMTVFCRPFTSAQIRYFDRTKAGEAYAWIEGGIS